MSGWKPGIAMALSGQMECWTSFTRSSPTCLYFEDTTGLCLRICAQFPIQTKQACPSQGKEASQPLICTCASGNCRLHGCRANGGD